MLELGEILRKLFPVHIWQTQRGLSGVVMKEIGDGHRTKEIKGESPM